MVRAYRSILLMFFLAGSLPGHMFYRGESRNIFTRFQDQEVKHYVGDQVILPEVSVVLKVSSPGPGNGSGSFEEVVHRGPVAISLMYGMAFDKANTVNGIDSILGQITVQQNKVTKQLPWSNAHTVRLYLDLQWSGIEQFEDRVRDLHSQGKKVSIVLPGIILKLSLDEEDGYFGEIENFAFDFPRGGWLSHDLPDGIRRIFVRTIQEREDNNEKTLSKQAWEVDLFETTPQLGRYQTDICAVGECISSALLSELSWQVKGEDQVPVFCPGQMAHGMTIKRSWLETRTVWEDFTREQGMKPYRPTDLADQNLLFVEIAAGPPKRSFILASIQSGAGEVVETDVSVLYGQSSNAVMQDRYASGLRFADEALVLAAFLPNHVSIDQLLLVNFPYGPVWRLTCEAR